MNNLQWYAYISGIVALIIACFFYFQSRKEDLSEKQIIVRKRIMNFFLTISFICVVSTFKN